MIYPFFHGPPMMVMVILELVCPTVANFSSPSLLAKGHKTDPMFLLKSIPLVRMISHSDWFLYAQFLDKPLPHVTMAGDPCEAENEPAGAERCVGKRRTFPTSMECSNPWLMISWGSKNYPVRSSKYIYWEFYCPMGESCS